MKHFFTLFAWALAVALVGCNSDDTAEPNLRFTTPPQASDVSVTTATVAFPSLIDNAMLSSLPHGIAYGELDAQESDYTVIDNPDVDGGTLRCRLTDLRSGAEYRAYAFVRWGMTQIRSEAVTFRTDRIGSTPVLEITSLQPMNLPAAADDCTITYLVHNPIEGEWAEASSNSAWVNSIDNTEPGEIAFHVDSNPEASERNATLTLTYTGASPVTVRIRQAGQQPGPDQPEVVQTLTADAAWPDKYPSSETTCTLGGHEYRVRDVADYGNGIQLKKVSGYLANAEDMGPVRRVEVVYKSSSNNTDMTLLLGDSPASGETELNAVKTGGTYVFDCSGYAFRYFTLRSGDGASFIESIKITWGGKGGTTPDPDPVEEPQFGSPSVSALTKNSATITCSYTYAGDKRVAGAWFVYNASGAAEQRAMLQDAQPGTKTVSLTGLTPATRYSYRLCVEIDGRTYTSGTASLMTLDESGKPGQLVRYSGWAELPIEMKNSDYYYAYHLIRDFQIDGHNARNYTVCYSAEHHNPVWVAAPLHRCYVTKSGNRNYSVDPDIPSSIQPTSKSMGAPYNKGHMLGNRERSKTAEMRRQVCYYTNISPQNMSTFNTGGGAWNNLENQIDNYWDNDQLRDTLYVVIGAYFDNWTDSYGNSMTPRRTTFGGKSTSVPTMFYYVMLRSKSGKSGKWVTTLPREELQCAAFVMSHAMQSGHKPQVKDMRSVSEIEQLTGFTFFSNVPQAPKDTYNPGDWGM